MERSGKYASLFHDKNEELVAVLGQKYLDSYIKGGGLKRSLLLLTDKRVYQKGTIYEKAPSGTMTKTSGNKVVNVESVTGTSFSSRRNLVFLGIFFSF